MTSDQHQILEHLLAEGFQAAPDSDGDIAFKCEGYTYVLCFDANDPLFGKLVLPNVWEVSDAQELQRVLTALDGVNRKMKVVKAYTQRDQVSFAIEMWIDSPLSWAHYLHRALRALAHSLSLFGQQMRAAAPTAGLEHTI